MSFQVHDIVRTGCLTNIHSVEITSVGDLCHDTFYLENSSWERTFGSAVTLFGKTDAGQLVCMHVPCPISCYIRIPEEIDAPRLVHEFIKIASGSSHYADVTGSEIFVHLLYGFEPDESVKPVGSMRKKVRCINMRFSSRRCMMRLVEFLEEGSSGIFVDGKQYRNDVFEVIEAKVSLETQFMDKTHIYPGHWIYLPSETQRSPYIFSSHKAWHYFMQTIDQLVVDHSKEDRICPFTILSVDIECYSHSNAFPNPAHPEDCVFMIGNSIHYWGNQTIDDVQSVTFLYSPNSDDGNIEWKREDEDKKMDIRRYETEIEMLVAWHDFVTTEVDPDIVVGYNLFQFDWPYMYQRAMAKLDLETSRFFRLGRLLFEKRFPRQKGDRDMTDYLEFPTTGRIVLDLYQYLKSNFKLPSYSLNNVSNHFLNHSKVDLSPRQLFESYRSGDVVKSVVYCAKDCELPLRLMEHLSIIPTLVQMAHVTKTPIRDVISRGEQIRVWNQLVIFSHEQGFIINYPSSFPMVSDYEGGCVLDPLVGFHRDPVVVMDFASLYPSIMQAKNFCHSTYVMSSDGKDELERKWPGAQFNHVNVGSTTFSFVSHVTGILPQILSSLLTSRRTTKEKMKEERDPVRKSILNARQLALKVSCNAVYGFCGVDAEKGGILPCIPIAVSTTTVGREMIRHTKHCSESIYNAKVVYGDTDSVMVQFPEVSDVEKAMEIGQIAANRISQEFPGCLLEFEEVFDGMILVAKKRYAAMAIESRNKPAKFVAKGLEIVRRDTCAFVRETFYQVLMTILKDKHYERASKYATDTLHNMVSGKLNFDLFVTSKSLRVDYTYKNNRLPHLAVVERIRRRKPGSEPKCGDRVHYVVLKSKSSIRDDPLYMRVEDATYARENNLLLDFGYYLKMVRKPLMDVFGCFCDEMDPESVFEGPSRSWSQKVQGTCSISQFMEVAENPRPRKKSKKPSKSSRHHTLYRSKKQSHASICSATSFCD